MITPVMHTTCKALTLIYIKPCMHSAAHLNTPPALAITLPDVLHKADPSEGGYKPAASTFLLIVIRSEISLCIFDVCTLHKAAGCLE